VSGSWKKKGNNKVNYSCEKKNTTNFISRESTLQGENRNPTFMAEKQELKDLRLIKYVATKNLKSQISSFLSDKFCFGSLWTAFSLLFLGY